MAISDVQRRILWVRSGGRCAMCQEYLLHSKYTERPIPQGEAAHNVGGSTGPKSPRGDGTVEVPDRDQAENLLLLCPRCHNEIDSAGQIDAFPEERLRRIKEEHERLIEHNTALSPDRRTVVLRVHGRVRGTGVDVSAAGVATAVLAEGRFPRYDLAPDRQGIEIDLRQLPGEKDAGPDYYRSAAARIDEVFTSLVRPAIERHSVSHLSVFAFARLPVLVYLGSRLDDTPPADVYNWHRTEQSWEWPGGNDVDFVHRRVREGHASDGEGVLVVNASGTTGPVPEQLASLPRWVIEPKGVTPTVNTVSTPGTLDSFDKALRRLLGELERTAKNIKRLHVIAAAPLSVAVTLGRSVGWGIHPNLAVYDLVDGKYLHAMEVTAP